MPWWRFATHKKMEGEKKMAQHVAGHMGMISESQCWSHSWPWAIDWSQSNRQTPMSLWSWSQAWSQTGFYSWSRLNIVCWSSTWSGNGSWSKTK